MLFEASTIASVVTVLIEAMEKHYNFDLRPALTDLGLDLDKMSIAGARYPDAVFDGIWAVVADKTGDDCVGLIVGQHVRPTTFHALGYAWLASSTLDDAFHRLVRFDRVISTADHIEKHDHEDCTLLTLNPRFPEAGYIPQGVDAYFTAILKLCRWVTDNRIAPLEVQLKHGDHGRAGEYVAAFDAPVHFNAEEDQLIFANEHVAAPLAGENTELASVSDRVAEHYLETLDPKVVASKVRELLIRLLPSGDATLENLASQLTRSTSTLQRQLTAEGASFAEIRDDTRKTLAVDYLREGELSLMEIAFLTGFSDQSNFSRAFRRWTGYSPKEWREHGQVGS
jgi:AraC-like DNA-binding protein